MRFDAFTGGSYRSQSPLVDLQRTMNWYPEVIESQTGKNARYALYPTPGVALFATLPVGPVRGLYQINGRVFAVGGGHLYELDSSGVPTRRSDAAGMASDTNPASMTSNGDAGSELGIASGGTFYLLNLSSNAFSAPATGGAITMLDFLDGYFLGLDATTSTLRVSELLDGTTWDVTQIAQRNTGADRWIGMRVSNRLIYLWGNQTSEVWYNAGTSPFPFEAIQEAFMPYGIIGSFAHTDAGGGPLWIGANKDGRGMVLKAEGYTPKRISDHAIEHQIQGYGTVSDIVAYSYQDQGHPFSLFSFPTANATHGFDDATGQWHERGYWDQPVMAYRASRQLFHCFAFGKHLVGDRLGSGIYEMSTAHYLDVNNDEIRRLRRAPHINQEQNWISIPELTLDLETGVGTATGQGANPQAMLRWSTDNGRTWSNEYWAKAGKAGEYRQRVVWRRLGRGRDFVFEVIVTDPAPWRIANCYLRLSGAQQEAA